MSDPVTRFELFVLRPFWVALAITTTFAAFRAQWSLMAGALAGMFYLGVIGSKLHPLQSARDLTDGPTTSDAAVKESACLSDGVKSLLVGQACTRVALLLCITIAFVLLAELRMHWYIGVAVAWVVSMLAGGILKFLFQGTSASID